MSIYGVLACLAIGYYLALYSIQMLHLLLGYRAALHWKKLGYQEETRRLSQSELVPPISVVNDLDFMGSNPAQWVDKLFLEHFPEFELLVMSDDEDDKRVDDLIQAYFLRRVDRVYRRSIESPPPLEIFQSDDRRLSLVRTGKLPRGAILNLALNLSKYPLLAVAGEGAQLEEDILIRMVRPFMEGRVRVPSVMGMELPLEMEAEDLLPPRRITKYSLMESLRVQLGYQVGAPYLGGPVTSYSPLALFRKKDLLEAGGFNPDMSYMMAEMDMLLRMHRSLREQKTPYRFVYLPQAVVRRPFPERWSDYVRDLKARRDSLSAVLWAQKDMLLRARYGRLGLIQLPAFWIFVKLLPVLGFCAYALVIAFFAFGLIGWPLFVGFLLSSIGYPALVGVGTVIAARRELGILKGQGGILYGYAFMTQLWFRQFSTLAPIFVPRSIKERRVEEG
ncbi:MAG: hypothetical protein A2W01_01535 [Candidatus Solincola sediminis]|uniref:Glycosyltransferase 2-like domain-containing protein n=1 Tax=Candidatus Solincola sediminis TaxID=1797199 RepID=A0A1F2WHJ1_9ACTN|nr:MAG: hypothetical protein A2Y75_03490 [Candidatus Solincola sediminis]OFW58793.1 MAG: hypothetical protein A2W01_01535 [Candidatus Solincola sediminis]